MVLLQQVRLAPTSAPACPLCPQCTQTLLDHQLCLLCDGDDPSFCYDCATITTNFKYYSTSGYYADSEGVCQLCPNTGFELSSDFVGQQPCIECANLNGTCTGCIDGYGAIAGECVQCEVAEPNCASCDGDAALCSACNEGYGLTNSGCQACAVENCASCDGDAAVCQSCKYGHGLVDGSCQACTVEKCANCDGNTGVCLK